MTLAEPPGDYVQPAPHGTQHKSAPPELRVLNHTTLAEQVYQHLRQ
jgi:hypothetical protein